MGKTPPKSFPWGWLEQEGRKLEPLQGLAVTFCLYFCHLLWKPRYSVPLLSEKRNCSSLDQCFPFLIFPPTCVEGGSRFWFTPWEAAEEQSLLFPFLGPLGDDVPNVTCSTADLFFATNSPLIHVSSQEFQQIGWMFSVNHVITPFSLALIINWGLFTCSTMQ